MQKFEMTTLNCGWGWRDKFWLAFYHLHDIPKIQKFQNKQSTSFGNYSKRQTADSCKTEGLLFHTVGIMKRLETLQYFPNVCSESENHKDGLFRFILNCALKIWL